MAMIRQMCQWLVSNGLAETPLHFSRFFPRYMMQDIPPTPRPYPRGRQTDRPRSWHPTCLSGECLIQKQAYPHDRPLR